MSAFHIHTAKVQIGDDVIVLETLQSSDAVDKIYMIDLVRDI